MKKLLCLLLALTLTLPLLACAKSDSENTDKGNAKNPEQPGSDKSEFEPGVLYVGYGRTIITPEMSTPLGGYGASEQRMHDRVLDDLMATCVAFTDGADTFLLFSADAVRSNKNWTKSVRDRIEQEFGIPGSHVIICSSHSHSAPDTTSTLAAVTSYANLYTERLVEAAKIALEDRTKATMSYGSVQTENMTFVRHYEMNDGSVAGPNFGTWSSGIKGHIGRNDPEMILYKLEREGGKKPVLMMNFQAHTTFTGGSDKKDISADYVGVCREILEDESDVLFAYYLGACGNQTPNSYDNLENNTMPFADQLPTRDRDYISYGTALALYAQEALPNLQPVEARAGIQTATKVVTVSSKAGSVTDEQKANAMHVIEVWNSQGRDAGNAQAQQYGFASVYEANGILGMEKLDPTHDIEVCATRIGNMYFTNVPYEMFSENALYIKENAPAGTMVITQSNHAWGYITDKTAHQYKCYENFGGTFAEGSGELLVESLVDLLKTLG